MKTQIVSVIAALLGMLQSSKSQANPESDALWSGSFTTKFNTEYIGKIGTVFYRSPTVANSLDLNMGKDWTVQLWSSTALGGEGYGETRGDEIDFSLMWRHQFGDFKFSLTGCYFVINDLDYFSNDVWIAEAELSYTKYKYFQPYFQARYFGQVTPKSPDDGWFGWVGFRQSFNMGSPRIKLTTDVSIAYSDGALGKDKGLVYGRAVIGLPIQLRKNVTLTPSVLLQTPIGNQRGHSLRYTDRNEVIGSLAVSFRF